jgi:Zn-dependent protease
MQLISAALLILILMYSAIVHEVMHGVAAEWLGDKTARYAGRLTLNPLPHLDLFGSVLLPLLLVLTNAPVFFAWAKPVPYNPYNLRPGRFSEAIVAGAGPFINLVIALLFGAVIRLGIFPSIGSADSILFLIVVVNVMLCCFNLIPVPPLDGSKVLEALLPRPLAQRYFLWRRSMEYNPLLGMGIVLVLILLLGGAFSSFIYSAASAIAGL